MTTTQEGAQIPPRTVALRIDGLTITQAAALLGMHRNTVKRLVLKGAIPHTTIGRFIRFDRETLNVWMRRAHEQETADD